MMIFKRKQVVVLSLVLMIIIAGYLQYSYNKSSMSAENDEKGRLGEAVYVDNNEEQDKLFSELNNDLGISASAETNDFFSQAKLDREITRSRDVDVYGEITEDVNASKEIKSEAYEKMMSIMDTSEKEMRIETLIKERGFADVIALFGDDGSVDIIVKAPSLSSAEVAQISDITSRQANVDIPSIHIKIIY